MSYNHTVNVTIYVSVAKIMINHKASCTCRDITDQLQQLHNQKLHQYKSLLQYHLVGPQEIDGRTKAS